MYSARCNRLFFAVCFMVLLIVQSAIATIEMSAVSTSDGDDNDDSTLTWTATPAALTDAAICNTAECINQQLQSRLDTIESAFRMLVLSLSSQTNDLFTPIKEMLAQDPSVRLIQLETSNFQNSTTFSATNESHSKSSFPASFEQSHGHATNGK